MCHGVSSVGTSIVWRLVSLLLDVLYRFTYMSILGIGYVWCITNNGKTTRCMERAFAMYGDKISEQN